MTKKTFAKVFIGVWASAAIVVGAARQLSPSIYHPWEPPPAKKSETAQWVQRAAGGDLKTLPRLRCASAFIVDNNAGEIVFERNAYTVRPIASITKLLTAIVFLESGTDLNGSTFISEDDAFGSSKSRLRVREEYTFRDLLYAALVSSDNRAARALSRTAGMSSAMFIARMNDRAKSLGMDSTHVIEPTGLSDQNRSNARDCAILVNAALKNHLIRHISSCSECYIHPLNKRRTVALSNTNRLLDTDLKFLGAKTGFIHEAGWCIGARALSPEGDDVTAVVLGAPSARQRFASLAKAFEWAFDIVSSAVN